MKKLLGYVISTMFCIHITNYAGHHDAAEENKKSNATLSIQLPDFCLKTYPREDSCLEKFIPCDISYLFRSESSYTPYLSKRIVNLGHLKHADGLPIDFAEKNLKQMFEIDKSAKDPKFPFVIMKTSSKYIVSCFYPGGLIPLLIYDYATQVVDLQGILLLTQSYAKLYSLLGEQNKMVD